MRCVHRYWYTLIIYFPHWPVIRIQKAIPIICLGLKATKAIIFGKRPYLWGDHIFSVTTFKKPSPLPGDQMIDQVVEGRWTTRYKTMSKLRQRFLQKWPTKPKCYKWYFWIDNNVFFARNTTNWWPLPSWADLFHHLMASARTGHCPGGGCIWESGKPHRVA